MKIYRYTADSDMFVSFVVEKEFWPQKNAIGKVGNMSSNWKPLPVSSYFLDEHGTFPDKQGDFPSLKPDVPVISEKAKQILLPFLNSNVEALPVLDKSNKYYALNILDIVDALDKEKSDITFRSSGNVSSVHKYVFDEDKVQGKYIFKLPETKGLETYVTEEFRDLVEKNNLKGLDFSNLIYTS